MFWLWLGAWLGVVHGRFRKTFDIVIMQEICESRLFQSEFKEKQFEWWQHEVIYHVFIPSFYEAAPSGRSDGMGDLKGRKQIIY
jgi:hypothetical protein